MPDNSVDLAVSRGSVFFWQDQARAFQEIYRVLAPLGTAYIGGGFGSSAIKDEIAQKMEELDKGSGRWQRKVEKNLGTETSARLETALKAAKIQDFEISSNSEIGLWVLFKKQKGIKCHQ